MATFLAAHRHRLYPLSPPRKGWVARVSGAVAGVLVLRAVPCPCLDYIAAEDSEGHPIGAARRLRALTVLAERYLQRIRCPAYVVAVSDANPHYQAIVRRWGFEAIGPDTGDFGGRVGTVYLRRLPVAAAP